MMYLCNTIKNNNKYKNLYYKLFFIEKIKKKLNVIISWLYCTNSIQIKI